MAGITGWFIRYGFFSAAMPPAIWSPSLYKLGYDLLAGNINLVAATTLASITLATNLTILTKFLKSDTAPEEAEHKTLAVLRLGVSALTICAAITAITVWAGVTSRADASTACMICVIALLAVAIGISALDRFADLAGQPVSALEATTARLELLQRWQSTLSSRRVHQPLGLLAGANDHAVAKQLGRRAIRRCALHLTLLGLFGAVYIAAVFGTMVLRHGGLQHHAALSRVALLACLIFVFTVLGGGLAARESVRRWTAFTATNYLRIRLVLVPAVIYTLYGLLVAVTVTPATHFGVMPTLIVACTLAGPAVVWTTLWASRRWPTTHWLVTLTWPVWGAVELSLNQTEQALRTKHDELTCTEEHASAIV